jgi:hypothetical protein
MITWDEIKRETEERATKLWADEDELEITHLDSEEVVFPSESPEETQETKTLERVASPLQRSFVAAVLGADYPTHDAYKNTQKKNPDNSDENTVCCFPSECAKCPSNVRVSIGDPIGIRSIQSIMMSATQMNLSHFHTAGMLSSSSIGRVQVPSAADAMNSNYTKINTSMKFTLQKKTNNSEENNFLPSYKFEQLRYLRKNLVGASLGHFVRKIESDVTEFPDRENIWYTTLRDSRFELTNVKGIVVRIYIDYTKMHNHGLTLEHLAQKIFGNDCPWNVSPDFMGMIDIWASDSYISQWLSRIKHRVCGTSDILSCDYSENTSSFITRGTNVLAACKVPGIDKSTIELNNVISVEKHFGIEAATKILAGLTGNIIVSDFMARTGKVLHFSKFSSEVYSKGLLTSMGFERPKDDIKREISTKHGVTGRVRAESVYEHIITGRDPPLGFSVFNT